MYLQKHLFLLVHFFSLVCPDSVALCVPAVIPAPGADGELSGQCRGEAEQAAALLCQTPSSHSTRGGS